MGELLYGGRSAAKKLKIVTSLIKLTNSWFSLYVFFSLWANHIGSTFSLFSTYFIGSRNLYRGNGEGGRGIIKVKSGERRKKAPMKKNFLERKESLPVEGLKGQATTEEISIISRVFE